MLQSIIENFWQAAGAIKENRLRTMMSITGIAVGIASVMTVGVISQSGRDYIYSELSTYGLNSLWVYREWEKDNPFEKQREGTGITSDDYAILKSKVCCPSIIALSPSVYPEDWLANLRVGNSFNDTSVEGVDLDFLKINKDKLSEGRQFRKEDIIRKRNVALIGPKTKNALFGTNGKAIGKNVYMGTVKFTVIGILKHKKRDFLDAIGATQGYDENDRMLIPYTRYQQILGTKDIHTIRAESKNQGSLELALDEITSVLDRRHNKRYTYKKESMREWINTTNNILETVSSVGIVSAVVALLVGGIGIFNIMSSSVVERTREIGIRKALGATKQDILQQFLIESIYISVIGGIIGSVIGGIILVAMIYFTGFSLTAAWGYLIAAIIVSVVVGLFAGFFPAKHAAEMTPVDALRYE